MRFLSDAVLDTCLFFSGLATLGCVLFLMGCCSVPCSAVEGRKLFEDTTFPRFEAYIDSDQGLSDAEKDLLKAQIEAQRAATDEAEKLCAECNQ